MTTLLENEVSAIKKIRSMAGCKRAPVKVIRNLASTAYLLDYDSYKFAVITYTTNELPMALYDDYKSIKNVSSSFHAIEPLTVNSMGDKKFMESDFIYASGESIVYSLDSIRMIAGNLGKQSSDYQAYQSRPVKSLMGLIKSRKGKVTWGIGEHCTLNVAADLGYVSIEPSFKLVESKPEHLNVINQLSDIKLVPDSELKTPVFSDKILESMTLIGYCQGRLAAYQPKNNYDVTLYTILN